MHTFAVKPRLTRREAAEFLVSNGYPVTAGTLSTMASRGGGPAFLKFGASVLYDAAELSRWAEARLTPPRRSTSEAGPKAA